MKRIKVKESICILEESLGVYQVVFTGTRRIKRFGVDNLIRDVISQTIQEQPYTTILQRLSKTYDEKDVHAALTALEREGIIWIRDDVLNKRNKKQVLFIDELTNSWEETQHLQQKIQKSIIAVCGVGGIGSWIANGLYQLGVNNLCVIDPDIVSESNLNRQLHFSPLDIGEYKVDVLKEKLVGVNITTHKKRISTEMSLDEILNGVTFIVNCADSPSVATTTRIIDAYARPRKIPYCVSGGYNLHLGMVGPIIIPGETACFDCFLAYQKKNDPLMHMKKIKDVEQSGNLGPIAGAIANIQLMEIFKFIIGKGSLNINRFAEINFLDLSVDWREYGSQPNCEVCYKKADDYCLE